MRFNDVQNTRKTEIRRERNGLEMAKRFETLRNRLSENIGSKNNVMVFGATFRI